MGGFMAIRAVGSIAGVIVLLLAVFVIGMRFKLAPVLNAVRRFNRSVTNPRVLRTAGAAGEQTSVSSTSDGNREGPSRRPSRR
jgi:hypothetical protein